MEREQINKNNKTNIWSYYIRHGTGKDSAKCIECKKVLQTKGGSTSGLHSHLKTQHNINLLKKEVPVLAEAKSSVSLSKVSKVNQSAKAGPGGVITNYFKQNVDESFPAVLSRLVAKDGLPFEKICTSYDLRNLLISKGHVVPKSPSTVSAIVMKFGNDARNEIKIEIVSRTREGARFSLTLDEWTSIRNHRFMNINVHTVNKFWNLGLARMEGYFPADKCLDLVGKKLHEFGLNLTNIVAITTDGAAVMKKLGGLVDAEHQLCLAHGLQLAVVKVLYNQFLSEPESCAEEPSNEDSDECEDNDEDDMQFTDGLIISNDSSKEIDENIMICDHIYPVIHKIRNIVKMFRRSPKNNDYLQKHTRDEFKKEIALILDTKTRWNSLLAMVERFYLLKTCVRKSFIDLGVDISFSENEVKLIEGIISSLLPIKLAVEALCSSNSTLLSADASIKFMLDELSNQNTRLSEDLKSEILFRLKERRSNYSDALQFLHNPDEWKKSNLNGNEYDLFNRTSKACVIRLLVSLIERLDIHNNAAAVVDLSESDESEEDLIVPSTLSMKERLALAIKQKTETVVVDKKTVPLNTTNLTKVIRRELVFFEENKKRGNYLERAYQYILTIKPTSVESERAFSAAGQICTKIRSRLNDKSVDNLCFLRAYFIQQSDIYKN